MKSYDVTMQMLGLDKIKDKQKLIDFFKKYSINRDIVIDPQKKYWCYAFVNACEKAVGNKGTGKLNAQSFVNYMKNVSDLDLAMQRDIIVFMKHVAFFDGIEKDKLFRMIRTIGVTKDGIISMELHNADRLVDIRRSY